MCIVPMHTAAGHALPGSVKTMRMAHDDVIVL